MVYELLSEYQICSPETDPGIQTTQDLVGVLVGDGTAFYLPT